MDPSDRLSARWQGLRRHPLFQAAVVYAGASWALLQGADIFFPTLGLPERAIGWLGLGLAAGFVVVELAVWRSTRSKDRAAAVPGEEVAPAPGEEGEVGAAAPDRTRRRRLLVYGTTGVLLALGGLFWWLGPRLFGRSVAPAAEVIAVLPFNTSGREVELLGEGMVDLLSTDLDGVGGIRTVDPRTVLHSWRSHAGEAGLDLSGALAVGREVDAGSVLLGSVVAAGSEVRLAGTLYAADGDELAAAQIDGPPDSVLALVDSLSLRLLRDIWRSREPIPDLRVSAITTGSVEAIRAYLRAEQFMRQSRWDSATTQFNRALEADSTFALAHYHLATAYGWSEGLGSQNARERAEAADRFADRLPAREHTLVVGHRLLEARNAAAYDTMKAFVARYPDDAEGWYLLGDVQYHQQALLALPPEELLAPFDRAIALDPSFAPAYIHPVGLSIGLADSAGFVHYIRGLEAAMGGPEAQTYALPAQVVWGQPDSTYAALHDVMMERPPNLTPILIAALNTSAVRPDVLIDGFQRILSAADREDPMRDTYSVLTALTLMGFGRLGAARAVLDSLSTAQPDLALVLRTLPVLAGYADPEYARPSIERLTSPDPGLPKVVAVYWRGLLALARDDVSEARRLVDHAAADTVALDEARSAVLQAVRGRVELAEGDTVAGIRDLREGLAGGAPAGLLGTGGAPLRFEWALALAARPATREEGVRRLRNGFLEDAAYAAPAYLALAQTLESAGDRQGAARAYAQFIHLWEGADPELQPRVEAARRALARLTAESPG